MNAPTLLHGRYRLHEIVGAGAQGDVRRAVDTRHDRNVAIKTRPGTDVGMLREARVLYDLRPHRSLPLLRDDFTERDHIHLVMDWVEGRNLAERIDADGPMTLEEAVELLHAVADALDHMHTHDPPIAHGDVKPANIIETADGHVVLVDLGLSGRGGHGTPGYRAPETATGPAGVTSDIYSLAATAYELLTGVRPGPAGFARMPGVPAAQTQRVRLVLEWGLQISPSRRPRRASTFVDALAGVRFEHNLPEPPGTLVGRIEELATLDDMLRSRRLVTVVGAGGVGKTRIAIEAASRLCAFSGGVAFVDLARTRAHVALQILRALGENEAGADPLDTVTRLLAKETRLLVLDNAEHVLDETAEACVAITERCPDVRLLVTSRESLSVRGETVLRIAGLPTARRAEESEAARLLLARVREIDPAAELMPADRDAAAEIASRVDGLPLALELAAARAVDIGLVSVADALSGGLDALGIRRGSHPHHRTLAAVVDHSYDLLDASTRRVLRAASVLIGGIDPAVLAQVADASEASVRSALHRAVTASMMESAGEERYRMLEPIRRRLAEHLLAAGDEEECRQRLAGFAERFFRASADALDMRYDRERAAAFEREEANLLEGLEALLTDDADPAVYSGIAACYEAVGRRTHLAWVLEEARRTRLEMGSDLPLRALAILGRMLAGSLMVGRARPFVEEVVEAATKAGDRASTAEALLARAAGVLSGNRDDALKDSIEAARLLEGVDEPALRARALTTRGKITMEMGDLTGALEIFEQAERFAEEHDLTDVHDIALAHRVIITANGGDLPAARRLVKRYLQQAQATGSPFRIADAWNMMGHAHSNAGEFDDAERCYLEARTIWETLKDHGREAMTNHNLGNIALRRGNLVRAHDLYTEAYNAAIARGDEVDAAISGITLADTAREAGRPAEGRRYIEWALPILRTAGDRTLLASAVRALAEIENAEGFVDAARDLARESAELYESMGNDPAARTMWNFLASLHADSEDRARA